MAITESIGYDGSVTEEQIPRWALSFAGQYGVIGAGDWKVTVKTGLDRTVGVASGDGFRRGVIATNAGEVTLAFDTQSAGSTRYDLVVAHYDWSGTGGTTTFEVVKGTTSQIAVFGMREHNPGVVDDQPIALIPVVGASGGGTLGTPIDLRVWQGAGGAVANHVMVLQYLDDIGTSVRIGSDVWDRVVDGTDAPVWKKTPLVAPVGDSDVEFAGDAVAERIVCSVDLVPGTWTVTAAGTSDWATAGGDGPRYILRLRAGSPAGSELRWASTYIGGVHTGSVPFSLVLPNYVTTTPTTIALTVIVTGPLSGNTFVKGAAITALRVA